MKNSKRFFIFILLLGFLLRIAVSIWSLQYRENTDILRWRDWGRIAYLHSLGDTYKPDYLLFGTLPNNMPPGTLYIVSAMYNINILFSKAILKITHSAPGSLQWVNGGLLNFMLRIPSLLADVGISILIYHIVSKFSTKLNAFFALSLFYFNPIVIYNSSFWGQMDSINNMFALSSIFCLVRKKYFLSIFLLFASLYIKLSLIFFLPLLVLLIYVKKNVFFTLVSIGISIIILIILTLPISPTPYAWIETFLMKNTFGEMTNITAFAFNFWWVIFYPSILIENSNSLFTFSEVRLQYSPDSSQIFLSSPLSLWGVLLFLLFTVLLILQAFKNKVLYNYDLVFLIFALGGLIGFLFLPHMHERYLYPIFPLLATYIGLKRRYFSTFLLLSILHMINLYIVWHPMKLFFMPYELISNRSFQWLISISTLFIGTSFYIKSLRILYEKHK